MATKKIHGQYYRTCQECGHSQVARDPRTIKDPKENWRNLLCKRCHSEAMDYGSTYLEAEPPTSGSF